MDSASANLLLQMIDLLICQASIHRAVDDTIAVARLIGSRLSELIQQSHSLHQIASNLAHH